MKKSNAFTACTIVLCFQLSLLFAPTILAQVATLPSGSGTSGDPYLVVSIGNLYWITQNRGSWSSYFIQTADINISESSGWDGGAGFSPIGSSTTYFTGSYDGQSYKITSLFINRSSTDGIGFFGYTNGATISNLKLETVSITGQFDTGGLIGFFNAGTITNCYSTGSVSGYQAVGGLIGGVSNGASISNCYSSCNASGYYDIGGLVGSLSASVTNCYARGSAHDIASGSTYGTGGLVGFTTGSATISKSYSTGAVSGGCSLGGLVGYVAAGSATNSFWDTQTSTKSSSAAGTGKTTNEMETKSTFTSAGWDATGTIWRIDATKTINDGYPFLAWQNAGGTALPVEMTSFTAKIERASTVLTWSTATEVNNYGFELERRAVISGQSSVVSWKKIGFMAGNGTSNVPHSYSYTDNVGAAGTYSYRLKQIDRDGQFKYSESVQVNVSATPISFGIDQNYPNPANPSTTISYAISSRSHVMLSVFNTLGQKVAELVNSEKEAGTYDVTFDASELGSGVYLYRIQAGSFVQTRKLVVMK